MDYVYLIITTINNLALLGLKLLEYLQTEDGKAFVAQMRTDRAGWDKFWKDARKALKEFFTGAWWKDEAPSPQLRTVAEQSPLEELKARAEKYKAERGYGSGPQGFIYDGGGKRSCSTVEEPMYSADKDTAPSETLKTLAEKYRASGPRKHGLSDQFPADDSLAPEYFL